MDIKKHRKAVAKKRGEKWKKALKLGRKAVKEKPSSLRKARAKKELTSEEISKKLGLKRSSYQEIETGRRMVKPEVAKAVANILKVPVKVLFKEQKLGRLRVKHGHNEPAARK